VNDFITRFGGGGTTHLAPFALVLLLIGIVLILFLPRKYVVIPFLLVSFFVPNGVNLVLGPFHFYALRILLVFGWIRILFGHRSSEHPFRLNPIDKSFLCYAISAAVIYCILWRQTDAFINRLGFLYTALGVYFFFRLMLEDRQDVVRVIKLLAFVCLVFAVGMVIERHTDRNYFSILGGIPDVTMVRDGMIRAEASFENAISAGIFGAALLPAFIGLWREKGARLFSIVGVLAACLMAYGSNSATPIMVCAAGAGALFLWPFRDSLKWFRRGAVAMIIGLQLVMKANVWALIERVRIGGGTSFHRYELVNGFIVHFFQWCLIGVRSTAGWGWFTFDQANEYVYVGANGGLLTFIFFIAILVYCCKGLGNARKAPGQDRATQWFLWGLGSFLFAHMVAFFGLSYFDQVQIQLYLLFAMIACITAPFWKTAQQTEPAEESYVRSPGWAPLRPRPQLKTQTSTVSKNVTEARPVGLLNRRLGRVAGAIHRQIAEDERN